jgi:hypothetical protein
VIEISFSCYCQTVAFECDNDYKAVRTFIDNSEPMMSCKTYERVYIITVEDTGGY